MATFHAYVSSLPLKPVIILFLEAIFVVHRHQKWELQWITLDVASAGTFCSWGSCASHLVIDKALKVLIVRVVRCDCNQLEWRGWALHVSGSNVKCVLVAEKHNNPGLVAQFERLEFKIFLPLMNTQQCFFPLDAVNSWVLFALNPSVPLSLGYP